ncbi:Histidine kinase [Myroides marinus]|uniref:histidine kinase n=2 Tax=Myroides marinus TaxID=703342 RepID=A0A1H6Y0M1_9FLAO|nr:Histidine kinase [Myroides marinus]
MLVKLRFILVFFCLCGFLNGCSKASENKDQGLLKDLKKYTRNYNRVNITEKTKKEADSVGRLLLSVANTKQQRDVLINYIFYVNDNRKYIDELLIGSKKSKDIRDEGYANYLLANMFNKTFQKDSTYYYLTKSEFLLSSIKDSIVLQDVYVFKAVLLLNDKIYTEGEAQIIKSMALNRDQKSLRLKYTESLCLTDALKGLEQFEEALVEADRCLKYLEDPEIKKFYIDDILRLNKISVYTTIADIYLKQKKYIKSKELIIETIKQNFTKNKSEYDPILLSKLLLFLAEVNIELKQYDQVEKSLKENIDVQLKYNNLHDYYSAKTLLAKYYFLVHKEPSALNLVQEVISYAKENKDLAIERDALLVLLAFYKNNNQDNLNRYLELNHLIQNENIAAKNMFTRMSFESDDLLKTNKQLQKQKRLVIKIAIGVFTLAIIIFFIILFRQKVKEMSLIKLFEKDTHKYYDSILNIQNELSQVRILERTQMAKELHDGVLNRLFMTRFLLMQLDQKSYVEHQDSLINEIKKIEEQIRDVSHTLIKDNEFKIKEFDQLLEDLIEIQNRNQKVKFSLFMDENISFDNIDIKYKIHIYRIIQECLQNVHKHAKATVCKVSFMFINQYSFRVIVQDNGVGLNTTIRGKGLGLSSIESRVKLMNSKLIVSSKKTKGTKILFKIIMDL